MKSKILCLVFMVLAFSYSCQGQSSQRAASAKIEQRKEKDVYQMVKNFYMSYASNVAHGFDSKNEALLNENMTQALIGKVKRMRAATQSDPIIRAQDFNLKDINTFEVSHLEGGWYSVNYVQGAKEKKRVDIPIRITNMDNKLLIDYITPEWNNSLYGDSLLCKQETTSQTIDSSSPVSLLKTFYAVYTMEYCIMPIDLTNRLDVLCKKHCTQKAFDEIQEARANTPTYDLLIDYYDFDKLWQPTLTFTQLMGDEYKVSYTKWQNITTNIYVSIIKKDGTYFIDDIRVEREY
ncbi:hypothetical protein IX307_001057 [Bacteroides pyogenes]|uniref:hypothetical protein n=1 Tax=Bacteroides pyogenes TaxID=310300 RepID=UPI001BAA2F8C|nr:hypothetical protein [Bacteroides pyogenes]MBR8719833.1 hypothetical protein [Bacteroides pyogenes]MBR8726300.1 hypothetical protein [Bacteroides pyogenes]MBR8739934.1 hypothetical protein [Bacteroides pyogenes]MBR8755460.1 hypothetical protein [Bacteroides pyogenes]MBR8786743.1 hypothetical protein [Bacteroides pyogenes]